LADAVRKRRRRFIQILLQLSLTVSVLLLIIGATLWVGGGDRQAPSTTPAELFGTLDAGHRLMLAGILLLAITPALRVVALLGLWIREGAWRFAATAALVLALLGLALWVGGG
jgi:uncharacterized membrane protein